MYEYLQLINMHDQVLQLASVVVLERFHTAQEAKTLT